MKASEIRELSNSAIQELIENNTKVLTRMRLNHAISPLDNPNKIGQTKKDIARLKTELKAREINQNK
jgi:large subunit ribosomal protein L29